MAKKTEKCGHIDDLFPRRFSFSSNFVTPKSSPQFDPATVRCQPYVSISGTSKPLAAIH